MLDVRRKVYRVMRLRFVFFRPAVRATFPYTLTWGRVRLLKIEIKITDFPIAIIFGGELASSFLAGLNLKF